MKSPPDDTQSALVVSTHEPFSRQHAPVGCGHSTAAHVVDAPWKVPPIAVQMPSVVLMHEPSSRQHAPVGCGQLTEAHATKSPWLSPLDAAQSAAVVSTHEPSGRQHAPVGGGQRPAMHVVSTPCQRPPASTQRTWVTTVHEPAGNALRIYLDYDSNAGTGMRVSVLMHLPGLVLDQKIEADIQELKNKQFTVRGFRGEGSTALGNLFQLSNSVTLGLRESEIVRRLETATRDLIGREERAREHLLSGARSLLEDRIWRSYGILTQARLLGAQEALHHASLLRLGRGLKILDLRPEVLNDILTLSQEAHSQLWAGPDGSEAERNAWRAERVRKKLQNSKS